MKKLAFFDQKHRLTPLEKCNFWHFEEFCFYSQKNVSSFSAKLLSIFSTLILTKSTKRKIWHFLTKSMALEKCDFWDFEKFCFYTQKKFLFYLEHYITLFLVLFWPKPNKEKIGIFWPKAYIVHKTFLVSLQSYQAFFSSLILTKFK